MLWLAVLVTLTWTMSSAETNESSIAEDFQKALALIPKDKIHQLAQDHLKNDSGFQAAVAYFKSEEWKHLSQTVQNASEWTAFKGFVKEMGIDLDQLDRCIEKFLEDAVLPDPLPTDRKSLKSFLMDVEQSIPFLEIIGALNVKMRSNQDFQKFFEKLASEESHKIFEDLRKLKEVKTMVRILEDMDLKVGDAFSFIYTLLGWDYQGFAE